MNSVPKFKKSGEKEGVGSPNSFFTKRHFLLSRNALDSMHYFPWRHLVQLLHTRRLHGRKSRKGGKGVERVEGFEEHRAPVSRANLSRELTPERAP